jgi:hypothetical protein
MRVLSQLFLLVEAYNLFPQIDYRTGINMIASYGRRHRESPFSYSSKHLFTPSLQGEPSGWEM